MQTHLALYPICIAFGDDFFHGCGNQNFTRFVQQAFSRVWLGSRKSNDGAIGLQKQVSFTKLYINTKEIFYWI